VPLHVRVTTKKAKDRPQQHYVRTDLTAEELEERVLAPYRRGDPLTIRGATVRPDELEKIEVFESTQPIAVLIEQVKREWDEARWANLSWDWDYLAAAKGTNRTDDFVRGAPGHEKAAAAPVSTRRPAVDALVSAQARDPRRVFLVHGRDQKNADAMFSFLRALHLDPAEFPTVVAESGEGSPYIGDVVRRGIESSGAVVVLMTPDEEASLRADLRTKSEDARTRAQPRPNVMFEAGMAMASASPRTVFVQIGEFPLFSDVVGRLTVRFDASERARGNLAERLRGLGCAVDTSGDQWRRAGEFSTWSQSLGS